MRKMNRWLACLGVCIVFCGAALAQSNFSSGSTGADGALAPTQSATIQVPASGVFNYTTVNIPAGVTITFVRNPANTPFTMLATSDIDISGSIVVDGQAGNAAGFGGLGGPGGGSGGQGGVNVSGSGVPGDGPGGGGAGVGFISGGSGLCTGGAGGGFQTASSSLTFSPATTPGGPAYGSNLLVPLVGGSGGGGGGGISATPSAGGGGGGGAILIASSTQIVFPSSSSTAVISARGGMGGNGGSVCSGGGGSGGAIHLMANTITGAVQLIVSGATGGCVSGCNWPTSGGGIGGEGWVRAEAFNLSGFQPTSGVTVAAGVPSFPTAGSLPSLQIASVAGVAAPANPVGSFEGAPDVVLPANQSNPVTVVVNAVNVPVGATVTVTVVPVSGSSASGSAALSGTTASSSASVSISLPAILNVLTATTTTLVAADKPMFINGERVDKVEVAATFGGRSQLTYITHSGRRVAALQ